MGNFNSLLVSTRELFRCVYSLRNPFVTLQTSLSLLQWSEGLTNTDLGGIEQEPGNHDFNLYFRRVPHTVFFSFI